MKKIMILSLVIFTITLTGCVNKITTNVNPNSNAESQFSSENYYTGSEYKGNYVYGAAMNLAWNDLADNILYEKLQLNTDDKAALDMTEKLNKAPFNKNDLDEASYYVKSGHGQKTVKEINKESRKKFPEKSFKDLELELRDQDIIAYAYFLKNVEYLEPFETNDLTFNNLASVKSFYASNSQKLNIRILSYDSDDKFIIKLLLKDNNDELILAKGYDMIDPQEIVREINKLHQSEGQAMSNNDIFRSPEINLDLHRNYNEMIQKYLANIGFEEYYIAQMFEDIKFKMDKNGAKVENQAVIGTVTSLAPESEPIKYKKLILDKPYWVIMKKTDSYNPYFMLGIRNTELMTLNK